MRHTGDMRLLLAPLPRTTSLSRTTSFSRRNTLSVTSSLVRASLVRSLLVRSLLIGSLLVNSLLVNSLLIGTLAVAALTSVAHGQAVEFALDYPATEAIGPRLEVLFEDVPRNGGKVGLRLAAGDGVELGLRLRQAETVATVGNIISVLAADASTTGRFGVASTTRGVLGPAAVRIRASVSDGKEPLAPVAEGAFGPLPLLPVGGTLFGLEAGFDYRVSRRLIIGVAPGMFLLDGKIGGRFEGEARFLRAVSRNDLTLLANAFADPGSGRFSAALGLGYTVNRRRAPSWTAAALFGWGPNGPSPGGRISGSERLGDGTFDLSLSLEPYRLDWWPYRIEAGYRHELEYGELRAQATAGLEPLSGWRAGARVGYRLPFTP